jgi:hypothetical protein
MEAITLCISWARNTLTLLVCFMGWGRMGFARAPDWPDVAALA